MKRFNGKPMSHWEREAKKLVVSQLLRGADVDTKSIIGQLASDRLLELARQESPKLLAQVINERNIVAIAVGHILTSIAINPKARARAQEEVVRRMAKSKKRARSRKKKAS